MRTEKIILTELNRYDTANLDLSNYLENKNPKVLNPGEIPDQGSFLSNLILVKNTSTCGNPDFMNRGFVHENLQTVKSIASDRQLECKNTSYNEKSDKREDLSNRINKVNEKIKKITNQNTSGITENSSHGCQLACFNFMCCSKK